MTHGRVYILVEVKMISYHRNNAKTIQFISKIEMNEGEASKKHLSFLIWLFCQFFFLLYSFEMFMVLVEVLVKDLFKRIHL